MDESERWIFNRLAGDYRARPAYPSALVDRLAALAGGAGPAVDLGAGTGLLAIPLAARGVAVRAVEPASAMLDLLREGAAGLPVEPVHASAEETGLPGGAATLVLLSDALQWVEPEAAGREAGRLLAPGGAVAVVEAHLGGSPFTDGLVSPPGPGESEGAPARVRAPVAVPLRGGGARTGRRGLPGRAGLPPGSARRRAALPLAGGAGALARAARRAAGRGPGAGLALRGCDLDP